GLAVLPARLKGEMELVASMILEKADLSSDERTAKHKAWFKAFEGHYEFTDSNVMDILRAEIGKTFVKVLEDAGVYKRTPEGRAAFVDFCETV
ncbi:MAG: galactose-1-phosphate uridylyltransferase, partial [Clostridia bacterium]|nr:galactose-1-phosphate uridylyltransferase [Clostridia bacterium]